MHARLEHFFGFSVAKIAILGALHPNACALVITSLSDAAEGSKKKKISQILLQDLIQ